MHEPEEQQLGSTNQAEQQGINLHAAYRVLVRAFYRLECTDSDSEEENNA
ncbi:MAG: hypothetical protein R2867_04210 [Caldilineaceae bacterium]